MDRITKRRKNTAIKSKFGINVNQYQLMLQEQNNVCFICSESETRDLAVDHCHTTGRVRGLLCSKCNTAIGLLKDNIALLDKAKEYLQRDYTAPAADDFDQYIEHAKRARWRVKVTTPDRSFTSIAAAATYYNVNEATISSWLGRLKRYPHLKKDGWEYEKVFASEEDII
jgi:hypothetical protein